jgi:hypothetical protein
MKPVLSVRSVHPVGDNKNWPKVTETLQRNVSYLQRGERTELNSKKKGGEKDLLR